MWDETPPAPIEIRCPACDDDEQIVELPIGQYRCDACGEIFGYVDPLDDWEPVF